MNVKLIEELKVLPDVQLVVVTKKHSREEVEELASLGLDTFGENRVQEFLEKYDPRFHWHLIGHLQTNKVKYIIGKIDLIESVDSLKLLEEIEKHAAKAGIEQDILIELHVSKSDENKTGLPPEQLDEILKAAAGMEHVRVRGLMAIATHTDDQSIVRNDFEQMKRWYDQARKTYPTMDILSMGMSSDWPLAVECGSNEVRVGTALFENN